MSQTVMGHGCCHDETQGAASSSSQQPSPSVPLGQWRGVLSLWSQAQRWVLFSQSLSCVNCSDQKEITSKWVLGWNIKRENYSIVRLKREIEGVAPDCMEIFCTRLYSTSKVLIQILVLRCWQGIKDAAVMNVVFGYTHLSCVRVFVCFDGDLHLLRECL